MITYQHQAKIIKSPYLLFEGANGHKCYGIMVQSLDPREDYIRGGKHYGKMYEYEINDNSLLRNPDYQSWLGLSDTEYHKLITEVKQLSEAQ